jgi:hypothetical protein
MVRDFNTVQLPNQRTVTTLESAISKHVETPAANALRTIQGTGIGPLQLSVEERRAVCGLAGLFHANSTPGRERLAGHLSTFLPKGGASAAQLRTMAQAIAFDRNDVAEVFAWEQVFGFAQVGSTATVQANLPRLTILLGQMMARSLQKMVITVYRLAAPPYLILPDLPVLGSAPPGGDIPDPGSFVLFPFEHRHLLSFMKTRTAWPECALTRSGLIGSVTRSSLGRRTEPIGSDLSPDVQQSERRLSECTLERVLELCPIAVTRQEPELGDRVSVGPSIYLAQCRRQGQAVEVADHRPTGDVLAVAVVRAYVAHDA